MNLDNEKLIYIKHKKADIKRRMSKSYSIEELLKLSEELKVLNEDENHILLNCGVKV